MVGLNQKPHDETFSQIMVFLDTCAKLKLLVYPVKKLAAVARFAGHDPYEVG